MTPEEINKKAYEKYPILTRGHGIDLNYGKREMYIEFLQEISALPTIKGWVARDKNGNVFFYSHRWKPTREERDWNGFGMLLEGNYFPDLRWEDEPIEVELPIIRK